MELDFESGIWIWVENAFLIIYVFEISVRIKREGSMFYCGSPNMGWNYLDSTVVFGGVLDMWFMPIFHLVQALMTGKGTSGKSKLGHLLQFLRMMRLVRIL